jgi:hypothetical protein
MFCQYVIRKYGNPNNATEEQKAEEFRKVYFKDIPMNLHTLQVVASVCGIRTNSVESKKMPAKLRGYHEVIGDHKNIYYREEDSLSGIQNTILHEIREMMETLFCEDNPTYIPLKTSARHLAAYFGEIGHLFGLKTAGCPGQIGHPHLNERRWTKIQV